MQRPCEDSSSAARERLPAGDPVGRASPAAQLMARKRRRGIMEKRRRDRINGSLAELRRLVPTAWERQGSANLDKAQILQMTVEHLRTLQTGGKGQQEVLALDFLSLGFRECVSEASCHLSTVEPLDSCDALRRRLLAHLSHCAAQRDAAAMTTRLQLRLQPRPPPYSHWVAALYPPLYRAHGCSAPQRPGDLLQHSVTSSALSPSSSSSSLPPPQLSTPLLFLPSSSSSQLLTDPGTPRWGPYDL